MEIGEPQREVVVEPLENPVPLRDPVPAPERTDPERITEPEPEKVPA